MVFNLGVIAIAALVPLVIGFVWYHPKVLGVAWMKSCGLKKEEIQGANMPLILGLAYLFSFMLGTLVTMMVIHQNHLFSVFADNPDAALAGSEINAYLVDFTAKYGMKFRTFGHGAFHGIFSGLFIALPIIGTNALFERKSASYIFIHVGYWVVSLALMGGIICQFS